MKKLPLFRTLFAVAAGCFILTCLRCNCSHNHKMTMYILPGEDTLYVANDTIQVATADKLFSIEHKSIYIPVSGTLTPVDSLAEKVDTLHFRTLYNVAVSIGTGISSTRKITALQIKYGIHNNTIKLYYKPLCLAWDNSVTINGIVYGIYSNHHHFDSNYYVYTSTGFQLASYTHQFKPDSTNYVNNIQIRHHVNSTTTSGFNWATDSTGDVRAVVYSFQEIYSLIKDNSQSDSVKIFNEAEELEVVHISTNPFTKHSVIMGPKNKLPIHRPTTKWIYYNVYADLAHLCPPDCGAQVYRLTQ